MQANRANVDALVTTSPSSEKENNMGDNCEIVEEVELNNDNNNSSSCDESYSDFHKLLNELGLFNFSKRTRNNLHQPNEIIASSALGLFRHKAKRVVIFGNAFNGKRTLCNHLRLAAMTSETRTREQIHKAMLNKSNTTINKEKVNSQTKSLTMLALTDQELREPLYNPYADNANVGSSSNEIATNDYNANSQCVKREEMQHAKNYSHTNNNNLDNVKEHSEERPTLFELSRCIGLSQCYIRNYHWLPLSEIERVSSEQTIHDERNNQNKCENYEDLESIVKCDLEFFCCDHAAALYTAIPNADCLEDVLLLIVIDVSPVEGILSTIRALYKQIEEHVTTLLRAKYANEYDTHLRKFKEEQQKLRTECFSCSDVESCSSIIVDSRTNENIVSLTESIVCPIRSMLVCTHTDSWNDIELNNFISYEEEQPERELIVLQNENAWHRVQDERNATSTHKTRKLPDAIKSIVETKEESVAEMIKENVCAEGTKYSLATLGISSHLVNKNSTIQESKNNVPDLLLTQMWNAVHCLLSPNAHAKNNDSTAKSSEMRCLQSLKDAKDEQNAWLVFADDNVHATSSKVHDDKISLLSEEERQVLTEYLLGNLHHPPSTSVSVNSSLNIITHRKLINVLEVMTKSSKCDTNTKKTEIKKDETNARNISCDNQVDSKIHPHNNLPSVSINSTFNTEGKHDNTIADDQDEQFVWDTV